MVLQEVCALTLTSTERSCILLVLKKERFIFALKHMLANILRVMKVTTWQFML